MIVYLDIAFVINFLINGMLLFLTGSIFKCRIKALRLILGSLFGAAYYIMCLILDKRSVLASVCIAFIEVLIAYKEKTLTLTLTFMVNAVVLAGILNLFYVKEIVLALLFPISAMVIYYMSQQLIARLKLSKLERKIEIGVGNRKVILDGFVDSGNQLSVAVINKNTAKYLLGDIENLRCDTLRCATVNGRGYMPVFKADYVKIDGKMCDLKIGIVNEKLSFEALLPAEFIVKEM